MPAALKVLLVDDEPPARRWLGALLKAHPGVQIVGEAANLSEAFALWQALRPEVIFLDVQMAPENGFDLLPRLQPLPRVVFVTAYDDYALRAFEVNALDYLLKPVHPERLAETLRRLYTAEQPPAPVRTTAMGLELDDFLPLRAGALQRVVQVREIALIEAEGAYTHVRLRGLPTMMISRRLREWEALLPQPHFARLDRSTIVNLHLVRKMQRRHRDEAVVELDGAGTYMLHRVASQRLRALLAGERDAPR